MTSERTSTIRTVAEAFNPRHNSLNAIRLALAIIVIVSHSWPTGGYGETPRFGDQDPGNWAVAGFFAISGYLITSSRMHTRTLVDYLWRRVLRIYPAFFVVLILMAFVAAPITASVTGDGTWSVGTGLSFVIHNIAIEIRQYGIGNTLQNVPYPGVWNGSLWTLFYEFLCYVAIGLAVTLIPRRWVTAAVAAAATACAAATFAFNFTNLSAPTTIELSAMLGGFFAGGALLYLLGDRVPSTALLAITAGVLVIVLALLGVSQVLAGLPVAYLMLYAGSYLPLQRIGATNDISYGAYIYAFPLQQILAYVFPNQMLPVFAFAAISIAITIPFAWASWLLVEQPALKLKKLTTRAKDGRARRSKDARTPSRAR